MIFSPSWRRRRAVLSWGIKQAESNNDLRDNFSKIINQLKQAEIKHDRVHWFVGKLGRTEGKTVSKLHHLKAEDTWTVSLVKKTRTFQLL